MSVYTTISMRRELAEALLTAFIKTCTDEELGDMADVMMRKQLYNVVIEKTP